MANIQEAIRSMTSIMDTILIKPENLLVQLAYMLPLNLMDPYMYYEQ